MAKSIFEPGAFAGKPFSLSFNVAKFGMPPALECGLVQHPLVTAEVQVSILAHLDQVGSASLAECAALLEGHPHPISALIALARAGIVAFSPGPIRYETEVFLPLQSNWPPDLLAQAVAAGQAPPPEDEDGVPPIVLSGIERLPAVSRVADVHIVESSMRHRLPYELSLASAGCYIATENATGKCYVGKSSALRDRVANGHLAKYDRIAIVGEVGGRMTPEEAAVGERTLGLYVEAEPGVSLDEQEMPFGAAIDFEPYAGVRQLVSDAVIRLAQKDFVFKTSSLSKLAAGPAGDKAYEVSLKMLASLNQGELHFLRAGGVSASAVKLGNDWILLADSEVRSKVVRSAGSIPSMLRNEWIFTGALVPISGDRYRLTSNRRFRSGSAAANFVLGSKGPNLAGWNLLGGEPVPSPAA